MQKPCPYCKKMLRKSANETGNVAKREMLGTVANPVVMRCTTCRKNFEFRGGKLNEIKRQGGGS